MQKYFTRKQVAEKYPISFSHLAHMASQGRGMRYRIIGKSAVYHVDDIETWLDSKIIEPSIAPSHRKRGRPRKRPASQQIAKAANDE